jgi:hypothetical protein
MSRYEPVPMVRCHMGPGDDPSQTLRYIPLGEFELWRFMMETRHQRTVTVDDVSLWVPEDASLLTSIADPELCEPVLRIQFDARSPYGVPVPVQRFLSAETYPEAEAALLSHFDAAYRVVTATAGYFVPRAARVAAAS